MSKQPTKRLSRQERHDALLQATYECVVQKGLEGTTIRDIADYAQVTFGLIRHYFASKDELIEATYTAVTADMTKHAQIAAQQAGPDPADQLTAFVTASLSEPFVSREYLAFWSNFVGKVLFDPRTRALHNAGYWQYRNVLTRLVDQTLRQAGHQVSQSEVALAVVKVNAVIDGMWIESCLDVEAVQHVDLVQAGIDAVGAVLNVPLGAGVSAE